MAEFRVSPEEVRRSLATFGPGDDLVSDRAKVSILELLSASDAPFSRSTFRPGHVTGSALVLSRSRSEVLLVWHARLERWLQPGEHVEPGDADLPETARREVLEETGIQLETVNPPIVALDVHQIPPSGSDPAHSHYDFMFFFEVIRPTAAELVPGARFFTLSDVSGKIQDSALTRALARVTDTGPL